MTKAEVENIIKEWNLTISNFMEKDLPVLLEEKGIRVKNGKISMNDWFHAQYIINDQNFYSKGHTIQITLRDAGFDVKMNMQDYTLVLY